MRARATGSGGASSAGPAGPAKAARGGGLLHLSAAQVEATVAASGLGRQEFAALVGCGTSQLFKYQKEGLPPRMSPRVRAALLEQAAAHAVVTPNAALREAIRKLKGE